MSDRFGAKLCRDVKVWKTKRCIAWERVTEQSSGGATRQSTMPVQRAGNSQRVFGMTVVLCSIFIYIVVGVAIIMVSLHYTHGHCHQGCDIINSSKLYLLRRRIVNCPSIVCSPSQAEVQAMNDSLQEE